MSKKYSINWENPELYDIVINTARFTLEDSAEMVVAAFQHRFPPDAGSPPT